MKKRVFATLLCVMMLMTLLPAAALAADGVSLAMSDGSVSLRQSGSVLQYKQGDVDWTPYTGTLHLTGETTSHTVTVEGGAHDITLDNVVIDVSGVNSACAFAISAGTVNLTLQGTNSLKSGNSRAGLQVPEGTELTINGQADGSGSLSASSTFGAGIGGGAGNGGNDGNGGNGGSGGNGGNGGGGGNGGAVTIRGGTVTASSQYGAGIGGGAGGNGGNGGNGGDGGNGGIGGIGGKGGNGGAVTISGGTVTANSTVGAGIGGGSGGDGGNGGGGGNGGNGGNSGNGGNGGIGGTVTISGGTVTANSKYGAGIGGGNGRAYGRSGGGNGDDGDGGSGGNGGTVSISGGAVSAGGTYNVGIGGGAGGESSGNGGGGGNGGAVTISGGTVSAIGTYNVGIGGGNGNGGVDGGKGTLTNGTADVYCTTLTLDGAAAGTPVAGLAAGEYSYGMNDVKTINNRLYLYLPAGTTVSGVTTGEDPARQFINQSATAITVANNHNNSGTLTEVFSVTLPSGTGYTATAEAGSRSPVGKGGSYSFQIALDDNYKKGASFAVKANGTALTPHGEVYTIENISTAQTVTVEGVAQKHSDTFSPSVYTLTFHTNGGSEISGISRIGGTTVDLTAYKPAKAGYDFGGWYSDSGLTNQVTSVQLTANATVYAKWTKKAALPFADVPEDAYYKDAVIWAVDNGVTNGTGEDTFSPAKGCTRAQVVTFLYHATGCPSTKGDKSIAVVACVEQHLTRPPVTGESCRNGGIIPVVENTAGKERVVLENRLAGCNGKRLLRNGIGNQRYVIVKNAGLVS